MFSLGRVSSTSPYDPDKSPNSCNLKTMSDMASVAWIDNLCFISDRIEDISLQIVIANERGLELSAEASDTEHIDVDQRHAAKTLSRLQSLQDKPSFMNNFLSNDGLSPDIESHLVKRPSDS